VWQWQDEKGKWNPYSASLSLELEEAQEAGTDSVDFEACHRSYTCNLKEMKQVNTVTKVKRDLERAKSGRCSARSLEIWSEPSQVGAQQGHLRSGASQVR
jgi:hypothetical protein